MVGSFPGTFGKWDAVLPAAVGCAGRLEVKSVLWSKSQNLVSPIET